MEKKEKRTKVVSFRLTEGEFEKLQSWIRESDMKQKDYLPRLAMQGIVFKIEATRAEEIHVKSITVEPVMEGKAEGKHRAAG